MNKFIDYSIKISLSVVVFTVFLQTVPFVKHASGFTSGKLFYEEKAAIIGETAFVVDVADTNRKREKGLSGREFLDPHSGMLFIFPIDGQHGIWMKDMNFSIDIIWINSHFEVTHIEHNVSPSTYPEIFKPTQDAKFVVELNAGFVRKYNIKIGDLFTVL